MKKITMRRYEIMMNDSILESQKSRYAESQKSTVIYDEFRKYLKSEIFSKDDIEISEVFNKKLTLVISQTNSHGNYRKYMTYYKSVELLKDVKITRQTNCYTFFKNEYSDIEQRVKTEKIFCFIK